MKHLGKPLGEIIKSYEVQASAELQNAIYVTLLNDDGTQWRAEDFARALGERPEEIDKHVRTLMLMGLLERNDDGVLKAVPREL